MLSSDVVEHATGRVFISRLFMVPKRDFVKDRLVVDLNTLNRYIRHHHFRMLMLAQIHLYLKKESWLASLDLKDA